MPGFYRASTMGSVEELSSDAENKEPDTDSSSESSFRSEEEENIMRMDCSEAEMLSASQEAVHFKAKKSAIATPKKRQSKLTGNY